MRVVVISDDCCAHTGFGTVVKNLFGAIHRDHAADIEVTAIALYPRGKSEARYVPTVRSAGPPEDDYGLQTLAKMVRTGGWPEVIYLLGDWWYWKDDLLNTQWRKENDCLSAIWYYAPIDGIPLSDYGKKAYLSADKLIAMSPFGRDVLGDWLGREVEYLPHGYDHRHYQHQQRPPAKEITFGVVSRNAERKNISTIVQAYWNLPEQINARLVLHVPRNDCAGGNLAAWIDLMGEGKRPGEWTDAISMEKNETTTSVAGQHIDGMSVTYRGRIDCLVSAGREGFGLPYLEGRVCGCRLILPQYSGHASMQYPGTIYYACPETRPTGLSRDVLDIRPRVADITAAMERAAILHATEGGPGPLPDAMGQALRWDTLAGTLAGWLRAHGNNRIRHRAEAKAIIDAPIDSLERIHDTTGIVMPGSHGDVMLATAAAHGLKKKYGGRIIFVTRAQYFPLLDGCPWIDEVIEYNPDLHANYSRMLRIYDRWFTPYFRTQVAANWIQSGLTLAEIYAQDCGVDLREYWVPEEKILAPAKKYATIHIGSGVGDQSARKYDRWQEVVDQMRNDITFAQVGTRQDIALAGVYDIRGKTTPAQLAGWIQGAAVHAGIDSYPMHLAAVLGTPSVTIWGNTSPRATGPEPDYASYSHFVEPPRDAICPRPCHRVECARGKSCINRIDHMDIANKIKEVLCTE